MKLILVTASAALIGLTSIPAPAAALAGFSVYQPTPEPPLASADRQRHCRWEKVLRYDRFGQRHVKAVRVCSR
jgi:hypothetical protein